MSTRFHVPALVVLAALSLVADPAALLAQAPAGSQSQQSSEKARILNSDAWKQMEAEFDKWTSMQVVYTPQQVQQLKADLAAEVQRMSAPELQQFLDQWQAKLKVLLGQDAAEAREWLGQFVSVAAAGYRKQVFERLGIENIPNMTADQIEEVIHNIRAKELVTRQQNAVYGQVRSQQLKTAAQFQSEQRTALAQAGRSTAAKMGSYQSHMAPKRYDWRPRAPVIPWGGWW